MRHVFIIAVVLAAIIDLTPRTEGQDRSDHANQQTDNPPQPSANGAVNNCPAEKSETAKGETPKGKVSPEWALVFIGIITAGVVGWQAKATADAARATEALVESGRDTAKCQLRAYLSVVIGEGTYQERAKNLRFEGRPYLINTGQTPAHKIIFKARAAILPIPLPKDYDLPETMDADSPEMILGIHQTAYMNAMVDGFSHDHEVADIKSGAQRGLFVWGRITYEDVFGDTHYTRFCQNLYWDTNTGIMRGFYIPGRNDAD